MRPPRWLVVSLLCVSVLTVLGIGTCDWVISRNSDPLSNDATPEGKAAKVAVQFLSSNDLLYNKYEITKVEWDDIDGAWCVLVTRLPQTPGAHRLVVVDVVDGEWHVKRHSSGKAPGEERE